MLNSNRFFNNVEVVVVKHHSGCWCWSKISVSPLHSSPLSTPRIQEHSPNINAVIAGAMRPAVISLLITGLLLHCDNAAGGGRRYNARQRGRNQPKAVATPWIGREKRHTVHTCKLGGFRLLCAAPDSEMESGESSTSFSDYAVLSLVPVVWGTYTPITKALYSLETPPPPILFNLLSYLVSFSVLAIASLLANSHSSRQSSDPKAVTCDGKIQEKDVSLIGGFELGLWLFLGSNAQVKQLLPLIKESLTHKQFKIGYGHSIHLSDEGLNLGTAYISVCSHNRKFNRWEGLHLATLAVQSMCLFQCRLDQHQWRRDRQFRGLVEFSFRRRSCDSFVHLLLNARDKTWKVRPRHRSYFPCQV